MGASYSTVVRTLLIILVVIGTLNFVWAALSLAPYPYDLDYSEGFMIVDTERLLDTGSLYPDPQLSNGFESVKYPPLYYLLLGLLSPVLGLSLFAGRLLNLAATVAVVVGIAGIARQRTGTWKNIIPLLFLTPYLTIFTGVTLRTDMVAAAFTLFGLYLFLADRHLPAVLLFIAAVFTKHSFIAGIVAAVFVLASQIDWRKQLTLLSKRQLTPLLQHTRKLWMVGGAYAAGVLIIGAGIWLWSDHFLQNVFASNIGAFEVRYDLINAFHLEFLPIFGAAFYYVYLYRDRLLGSYLIVSALIMILQMMRGGAWVYVQIEAFAAAVLCTAVLYRKAVAVRPQLSLLLLLQILLFFSAPFVNGSVFDIAEMSDYNEQADQVITAAMDASETPGYVEHVGYQLATDQSAISPEIWGVYEKYTQGAVSDRHILSFFRQQNYSYIITYKRLKNFPLDAYLEEEYRIVNETKRRDMLLNQEHWSVYKWTG